MQKYNYFTNYKLFSCFLRLFKIMVHRIRAILHTNTMSPKYTLINLLKHKI